MIHEKQCSNCQLVKPTTEFYTHKRLGPRHNCKECQKAAAKAQTARGYVRPPATEAQKAKRRQRRNPNGPRVLSTKLELFSSAMFLNLRKRADYSLYTLDFEVEHIKEIVAEFCEKNFYELPSASGKSPFQPSIDRIDNAKGYQKDNIRVVWLMENYCKNAFSDEQVIEFCKRKLGLI